MAAHGRHSRICVLSAAAPIMVGDQTRGAVVLEQAGDQLLDAARPGA